MTILSKQYCFAISIQLLFRLTIGTTLLLVTSLGIKAEPMSLTISSVTGTNEVGIAEEILSRAYKAIGLKVEFIGIPRGRGLMLANSGELDGEIVRIESVADSYPNLLKIPTAILSMDSLLIVNKSYQGAHELKAFRDYRIGIIQGELHAQKATAGLKVIQATTDKQLIAMLQAKRLDAIIIGNYDRRELEIYPNFEQLRVINPPLTSQPLYHFLHKKHASIIPKLNRALKMLKQKGVFETVVDKHLSRK